MAGDQAGNVIFLSIRPRFARAIMAGDKRVEFRRSSIRRRPFYAVVYATSPVRRVLGYFKVAYLVQDSPSLLWQKFGPQGGLNYNEFSQYYRGARQGTAIGVSLVVTFCKPVSVSCIWPSFRIPQSFSYLSGAHLRALSRAGGNGLGFA